MAESWIERNIKNPLRRFVGLVEDNPITRERRTLLLNEHPEIVDAVLQGGNIAAGIITAPIVAYAGLLSLPVLLPAMKVAGQAFTPSTWLGGISQAAGYTAPEFLLTGADLALASKYAYEAGKDIDKNGLSWKTGLNALLSLAPFTRETEAINATANSLKRPLLSVASVVDDFRNARASLSSPAVNVARELNRSIKNTKFVNMPIEHVSANGITNGNTLNSFSNSDVGFHFSPAGSPTTSIILQTTNYPFIRTGTFTYTNNTNPIFVIDKGNWSFKFNPEIYRGVNPGTTTAENAAALSLKAPNYVYINNYEGNGTKSYMTVEPSLVVLSKNELARLVTPIKTNALISSPYESYLTDIKISPVNLSLSGFIGDDIAVIDNKSLDISKFDGTTIHKSFKDQNDLLKFLSEYHLNYVDNLDPVMRQLYLNSKIAPIGKNNEGRIYITNPEYQLAVKQATLKDIDLFYKSDEYKDRFIKLMSDFYKSNGYDFADDFAKDDYQRFLNSLNRVLSKYTPVMVGDKSIYGYSNPATNVLGLSTYNPMDIPNTITHEFGHLTYSDIANGENSPIFMLSANDLLFGNPRLYMLPEALSNKSEKLLKYYSNRDELRLLLIPVVKEMFENGWTPEIAYSKADLGDLKEYFPKDYLIKILGGLLSIIPFIKNNDTNG